MVAFEYEVSMRAAMPRLPTPSAFASAAMSDFQASYWPPVSLHPVARAAAGKVAMTKKTKMRENGITSGTSKYAPSLYGDI
jgi:hypothetical protein